MSDGPLGVHDYGPTTANPAPIALAARGTLTWPGAKAWERMPARVASFHSCSRAEHLSRTDERTNFEYLGEDPYLTSRFAVALVEGIESQGVIATAKHFVANNQEDCRMDHSSDVDERTLREIYLPAFEAVVKEAHVGAIMDAYKPVNGLYMTRTAI